MTPTFHPDSHEMLQKLMNRLPQSLLLTGERGVGLLTAAKHLAGKNLRAVIVPQDKNEKDDPENGTITAASIRKLYERTKSKQTSAHIVIIDNAERMSTTAANAFLKLLEEPGMNIHFILTSHTPDRLLLTIRSRVQHVMLSPLTTQQTRDLLDSLNITDATRRRQLEFIASGLPAELHRLTADDDYFQARATLMGDARTLLTAPPYDKLAVIQRYQSSRGDALRLIESALTIAKRSLATKPQPALIDQLDKLLTTYQLIESNGNVRLQLARNVL